MSIKKIFVFPILIVFILPYHSLRAQDSTRSNVQDQSTQHGQRFVDEDGDGYNDNAPDHDNDGIPNGLDPDWNKESGKQGKRNRWRYIDLDGDGLRDNIPPDQQVESQENQHEDEQTKGSSFGNPEKSGGDKQRKRKGPNK